MIRTTFTPNSNKITFQIPLKYVGAELEMLLFPINDAFSTDGYSKKQPIFGCAKGKFKMSDDFDAPLNDFAGYI